MNETKVTAKDAKKSLEDTIAMIQEEASRRTAEIQQLKVDAAAVPSLENDKKRLRDYSKELRIKLDFYEQHFTDLNDSIASADSESEAGPSQPPPLQKRKLMAKKEALEQLSEPSLQMMGIAKILDSMRLDHAANMALMGISLVGPNDFAGLSRVVKVVEAALVQAECGDKENMAKLKEFRENLSTNKWVDFTRHDFFLQIKPLMPKWMKLTLKEMLDTEEMHPLDYQMFQDSMIKQ